MIGGFDTGPRPGTGETFGVAEKCWQDVYVDAPRMIENAIENPKRDEIQENEYIQKLEIGIREGTYPPTWGWEAALKKGISRGDWTIEACRTMNFYSHLERIIEIYLNSDFVTKEEKEKSLRNLPLRYISIDRDGPLVRDVEIRPHKYVPAADLSIDELSHQKALRDLLRWYDKYGKKAEQHIEQSIFESAETSEGSYPILPGIREIQQSGQIDSKDFNLIRYDLTARNVSGKNGKRKIEIQGITSFLMVPIYGYQNWGAEAVAKKMTEPRQYDPGDDVLIMGPTGPRLVKADKVYSFVREGKAWNAAHTAISVGFDTVLTLSGANLLRAGIKGATAARGLFQVGLGVGGVSHNAYWSSDPHLRLIGNGRGLYFMAHAALNLGSILKLIRPKPVAPPARFDQGLSKAAGVLESAFIASFAMGLAGLEANRGLKQSDLELRVRKNSRETLLDLRIEQLDRFLEASYRELKPSAIEEEHINRARNWLVDLRNDPGKLESTRKDLARQFVRHKNTFPRSSIAAGIALLSTFSEEYPESLVTYHNRSLRHHSTRASGEGLFNLEYDQVREYLINALYVDRPLNRETRNLGTILAGLGVVPLQVGIDMILEGLRPTKSTAGENLHLLPLLLQAQRIMQDKYGLRKNLYCLNELMADAPNSVQSSQYLKIWKNLMLHSDETDKGTSFEEELLELRDLFDNPSLDIIQRAEIFMLLANLNTRMKIGTDLRMEDMAVELTHLVVDKATEPVQIELVPALTLSVLQGRISSPALRNIVANRLNRLRVSSKNEELRNAVSELLEKIGDSQQPGSDCGDPARLRMPEA
ncbi:MAG: hypothetical protein KC777_10410 [Cyanobacteria bacterium HKST-UBA02]|nr:hypothetical protein [Cyanobacteria bacterium HKST-UBA02]